MTTTPATLHPVDCRPWCRDQDGHTKDHEVLDPLCFAKDADDDYVELSQHTALYGDGVGPDSATVSMFYDHSAGRSFVELATPENLTTMTVDEAQALRSALGRMIALAEQQPGEDVMVRD